MKQTDLTQKCQVQHHKQDLVLTRRSLGSRSKEQHLVNISDIVEDMFLIDNMPGTVLGTYDIQMHNDIPHACKVYSLKREERQFARQSSNDKTYMCSTKGVSNRGI